MAARYRELYLDGRQTLRLQGVEAADVEARLLLCMAAGCSKETLLTSMDLYASADTERKMREYIRRRAAGEPVAYILGSWEFYGIPLVVTPAVLIPRPDTEVLAEAAIRELNSREQSSFRVLDIGCGSGCISCAIGCHVPGARLTLLDVSEAALEVAKRNVQAAGLRSRAVCLPGNLYEAPPERLGRFDLIVSNPPYIASAEVETLDRDVKDYEPRLALDGGEDGLDPYRALIPAWLSVLSDNGCIMVEVGEGQARAVEQRMLDAGLAQTGTILDTAGTERVVWGKKI